MLTSLARLAILQTNGTGIELVIYVCVLPSDVSAMSTTDSAAGNRARRNSRLVVALAVLAFVIYACTVFALPQVRNSSSDCERSGAAAAISNIMYGTAARQPPFGHLSIILWIASMESLSQTLEQAQIPGVGLPATPSGTFYADDSRRQRHRISVGRHRGVSIVWDSRLGAATDDAAVDGALGGGVPVAVSQCGLRRRCHPVFYRADRHAVHQLGVGTAMGGSDRGRRRPLFLAGQRAAAVSHPAHAGRCASGATRNRNARCRAARAPGGDFRFNCSGSWQHAAPDRRHRARRPGARLKTIAARRNGCGRSLADLP